MAPNDLKWAKNDLWAKDSGFLNSAIETQKTQKFGVNSGILTPLEPLTGTERQITYEHGVWFGLQRMLRTTWDMLRTRRRTSCSVVFATTDMGVVLCPR